MVLILRKSPFFYYFTLFDLEMTLNITQTKKYFTTRSVLIFLYIWNKNVCDCSKETSKYIYCEKSLFLRVWSSNDLLIIYRHFFSPTDRCFLILEGCTKCWKGPLLLPSRVPPTQKLRPFFQFGSLTNTLDYWTTRAAPPPLNYWNGSFFVWTCFYI